jgi:formylglycine-generating enzyme required for sulfatase activity
LGGCKKKIGQVCGGDAECLSSSCIGSVCSAASCSGLAATCGPSANESCCTSELVPGGPPPYNRSNNALYPATVSDFYLDRFEITVGRFRKFVEAGKGTQAAGSAPDDGEGAHPLIAGSGWDPAWNTNLTANTAALRSAVKCVGTTWTDAAGANEKRPMTCITWYEAFAFCAWDGGRVPTEAEWNYAAAGGIAQRLYPWGSTAPDDSYAVYFPGSGATAKDVGTKSPKGDGLWGLADLAGNVSEWNLDFYVDPYPKPCADCANLVPSVSRIIRGGSHQVAASNLLSSYRGDVGPWGRGDHIGARCARSP